MKVEAIIPSAGLGLRLKNKNPKPLISIEDKPIFVYTLEVFEKCSSVDNVILVVHPKYVSVYKSYVKQYKLSKVKVVVSGGKTRQDSVKRGIKYLDKDTKIVVVHDGVRPFVSVNIIKDTIKLCKKYNAVVAAVPVKPTIKRVDDALFVEATLKRNKLWEVQTPQAFQRNILEKAYKGKNVSVVTDDASLVEGMGVKVKILEGDYRNIKITTPEDLMIARVFLKHPVVKKEE